MSTHNPERVQTWREWIATWERSGQTIHAFCRDRKLTRSNFDRWRRILSAGPGASKPSPAATFVPVTLVADPRVEIVLTTGVSLKVPPTAGEEAITRWLAAARAASC